ncbi:putative Lipoprotein, partial [Pseudomonas savastanoi pv. glycinea]
MTRSVRNDSQALRPALACEECQGLPVQSDSNTCHHDCYIVAPSLPLPMSATMFNKGLFLACALALLSACDSSSPDKPAPAAAATTQAAVTDTKPKPAVDLAALSKRYAGRELTVIDVSEIQIDGASALSVSFSVPLDPEQKFGEKLHLVDSKNGKVDGAWELSDNLMELRLRHLEPQRKLVLTVDAGLQAVNKATLAAEYISRLETRDLQATVGFASRGSLLPTRLAEGLPVIA